MFITTFTYSRHYAATYIFISIDLIFSQIVWCLFIIIFSAMDPSQKKLVVLLIFQFASFITWFYTSFHYQCGSELAFKSKCFIFYTSIYAWKWESWIDKRKASILWKNPKICWHWFNRFIQQYCFQTTISDDKTNFQIRLSRSWAITY